MSILAFQKPEEVVMVESTDTKGVFEFRPLEPGFGTTIGNALRRILLSSLEGFAITSIRIDGVSHEFASIDGVIEDVADMVLNFKQVRFKQQVMEDTHEKVNVVISGQEEFKAGDINKFLNVFQVLNPELVICHMDPSVKLNIELTIGKGRGYVPADENKVVGAPVDTIAIDSIYTPIRNVSFKVENYRVEQKTDYEKLVIEILTDGSINPKDALKEAAKILIYHFMLFSDEKITPVLVKTGVWAKKALKEAEGIAKQYGGEAVCVASSEDTTFNYIPKGYTIPADADYFHITTNNTIYGTEIREDFDCPVPLIADMSSDIMSRPVDVSKYTMIYGGAQKNVGPAGVTFVIVKEDALGKFERYIPTMLDYRTHVEGSSMFNTPPVFSIYVMYETLKWVKRMGGVAAIEKINIEKSDMLYNEIDRNSMFVGTVKNKEDRSRMNHCWVMAPGHEDLEAEFMDYAKKCGMVGIKGHRSVGGFRASLYNACTLDDVKALVKCMQDFEAAHK